MSELEQKCLQIRLILSDVDGVLTDGTLVYDNQGIETKRFHVRDGLGIRLWQQTGYQFGLITGRSSQIVRMRAAELDISIVRQSTHQKLEAVNEILASLGLAYENLCFIGDDLPDLPPICQAALGVAVADAVPELRESADYITQTPGGHGAVREIIELILKHQRRWQTVLQNYASHH